MSALFLGSIEACVFRCSDGIRLVANRVFKCLAQISSKKGEVALLCEACVRICLSGAFEPVDTFLEQTTSLDCEFEIRLILKFSPELSCKGMKQVSIQHVTLFATESVPTYFQGFAGYPLRHEEQTTTVWFTF